MFAGLLAAWAATVNGERRGVDTYLVESAALTFSPESLSVLPQVAPVLGAGELLASTHRTGIRGHSRNLVGGNL